MGSGQSTRDSNWPPRMAALVRSCAPSIPVCSAEPFARRTCIDRPLRNLAVAGDAETDATEARGGVGHVSLVAAGVAERESDGRSLSCVLREGSASGSSVQTQRLIC